ncbi:hypothetical protein KAR91_81480 [Candidatus Pacearchaeota archaeon]|nr:hypothetical protein [Candidatus Pacearchaeota archaeon]
MDRKTIRVCGSTEKFAEFGCDGIFYEGECQNIVVTSVGEGENMPSDVRRSLVGLILPTFFTKERLREQGLKISVSDESRFAYSSDIIRVLESNGKYKAAERLRRIAPNPLYMCSFERKNYEIVT